MKNAIVAALLACAFLAFSSCVSPQVDDVALFGPAQLSWPAVERDLDRGLSAGVSAGELTTGASTSLRSSADDLEAALLSKSRDAVRLIPWPILSPWVERGIVDKMGAGEIGPGVAMSLREQLDNFTELLDRIRRFQL